MYERTNERKKPILNSIRYFFPHQYSFYFQQHLFCFVSHIFFLLLIVLFFTWKKKSVVDLVWKKSNHVLLPTFIHTGKIHWFIFGIFQQQQQIRPNFVFLIYIILFHYLHSTMAVNYFFLLFSAVVLFQKLIIYCLFQGAF